MSSNGRHSYAHPSPNAGSAPVDLWAAGLNNGDEQNDMRELLSQFARNQATQMDLPPLHMITEASARMEAKSLTQRVFRDWKMLKGILERHESTIQKRWSKKPHAQRSQILLSAWPRMAAHHRPDFLALRKESKETRFGARTKFKDAYLWPYVNLEDLIAPKTLPLFLKSRGRNPPDAFAHADEDACHLGRTSGAINPVFLNNFTMFLQGQSEETYGRIYSWQDNLEAFDWMNNGRGASPGIGIMILEIQERILSFLIKCCQEILHEIPEGSLMDEAYPLQPEPLLAVGSATDWPKLASVAAEAPYRVPANIDFDRLYALVSARVASALDHVHALREDPTYFADRVYDWSEHRQEQILDKNGQKHVAFRFPSKNKQFWGFVLGAVIINAYSNVITWNAVKRQLQALSQLNRKYADSLDPTKPLPRPFHHAMKNFKNLLVTLREPIRQEIRVGFPSSPEIRNLWTREPQDDPSSTKIAVTTKPGADKDHLLWIFQAINDDQQLHLCGLSNVADELQRLMETDPKEKQRISGWVAEQFSELSLIAELLRQVNLFKPWIAAIEDDPADGKMTEKFLEPLPKFYVALRKADIGEQDFLRSGRFFHPAGKRPTAKNNESMRSAEFELDRFWRKVDVQVGKNGADDGLFRDYIPPRELYRTDDWVEPVHGPAGGRSQQDTFSSSLSRLELEHRTEKTIRSDSAHIANTKAKTKGTPQPPDAEKIDPENDLKENRALPKTTFAVSKRAYKVFSSLFFNPEYEQPQGDIPWLDFVHAMFSVGFAVEKLYGSIWQFTPPKLDAARNIQFHEPHPATKIPLNTLRRFGRRLNRQYGWTLESFSKA